MKIGRIALLCLLLGVPAGCGDDDSATGPLAPTPDEIVAANATVVREAVLAFAAGNGGQFPGDVGSDVTTSGQTVVDLLPDGQMLINPFTGEATEPRDGLATEPGQIGYGVRNLTGVNYGYTINAWGTEGELSTTDNIAELEAAVIRNALAVQAAAVEYYDANQRFPNHLGEFYALLPGGALLVNPFTHVATEPVDGAAASYGQVGYVPIMGPDGPRGYTINAYGESLSGDPLFEVFETR